MIVYGHQTFDRTGTAALRLVMFFSISGFLVAGGWASDPHVGRFVARRFLRIWPAYAVLIVACAGLTWLFPSPDMPELSRLASTVYLSNLWFHGFDWGYFPLHVPVVNQSLWMIPFEVDMYLAFALVAMLGRSARIAAAAGLLIVAMGAQPTTFAVGGLFDCWSAYFAGFFAFGVLLRELPALRRSAVVAASVGCGIAALSSGLRVPGLLLIIPPAAVWIGQRSWPVLRSAARCGDLSYGIFLWSFPVQQLTRLWLDQRLPVALQLGVVLLQVIPIAWLSYRFVEAPALRMKPPRPDAVARPSLRGGGGGWRTVPGRGSADNAGNAPRTKRMS